MRTNRRLKSIANYVIVFIMIIFGFIGLILPILPGIIFFVIALVILSFENAYVEQKILERLDVESELGKRFFRMRKKIERFFR